MFASTRALPSFEKTNDVRKELFASKNWRSPHNFSTLFDEFVFDFALTLIECVNKTVIEMMFVLFQLCWRRETRSNSKYLQGLGWIQKDETRRDTQEPMSTTNDGPPICNENYFWCRVSEQIQTCVKFRKVLAFAESINCAMWIFREADQDVIYYLDKNLYEFSNDFSCTRQIQMNKVFENNKNMEIVYYLN